MTRAGMWWRRNVTLRLAMWLERVAPIDPPYSAGDLSELDKRDGLDTRDE